MKQITLDLKAWIEKQIQTKQALVNEAIAKGKPFKTKNSEGFKYRGRTFVMHAWSDWMRGPDYIPSNCTCIPWEDCACGEDETPEQSHMRSITEETCES